MMYVVKGDNSVRTHDIGRRPFVRQRFANVDSARRASGWISMDGEWAVICHGMYGGLTMDVYFKGKPCCDAVTGKLIWGGFEQFSCLRVAESAERLNIAAVAGGNTRLFLFDKATLTMGPQHHFSASQECAFSPNGRHLLIGGGEELVDVETGEKKSLSCGLASISAYQSRFVAWLTDDVFAACIGSHFMVRRVSDDYELAGFTDGYPNCLHVTPMGRICFGARLGGGYKLHVMQYNGSSLEIVSVLEAPGKYEVNWIGSRLGSPLLLLHQDGRVFGNAALAIGWRTAYSRAPKKFEWIFLWMMCARRLHIPRDVALLILDCAHVAEV